MNVATCLRQRVVPSRCLQVRGAASKASNSRKSKKAPAKTPEPIPEPAPAAPQYAQPIYSSETLSHTTLPPAKMRALVALYHQAESWVTPETLLERIDETFVPKRKEGPSESIASTRPRGITFEEIEKAKRVILSAPKMSKWDYSAGAALAKRFESNAGGSWSNNRAERERKVIEALYGVVVAGESKISPGLDVVKESKKWISAADKNDN